jgi:hypothetical protein
MSLAPAVWLYSINMAALLAIGYRLVVLLPDVASDEHMVDRKVSVPDDRDFCAVCRRERDQPREGSVGFRLKSCGTAVSSLLRTNSTGVVHFPNIDRRKIPRFIR